MEILNEGLLRPVGKGHILNGHLALGVFQHPGVRGVRALSGLLNQFKDPAGAGQGVLQLRHHAGDFVKGLGVLVGVAQKGGELAHGKAAAHHAQRAHDAHAGVHQGVDEPGGGVGDGGEEDGPQAALAQPLVDLVELLQGFLLLAESLHHLLVSNHLFHKAGLLPTHLGLQPEHIIRALGDESRHQQGHRRDDHHHRSDDHIDAEHEDQRAQDGDNPGEQLGKAHEQAVGELVHIGNDPADHLPGGTGVDVFQGQDLELAEGLVADVPHHPVGDAVVDQVHHPLGQGGNAHHHGDLHQDLNNTGKIHLAGAHDQVHRIAGEDGNIQGARHRHRGQQDGEPHQRPIGPDVLQHLFQRALAGFLPLHAVAPLSSRWNWDSKISRYTSQCFKSSS